MVNHETGKGAYGTYNELGTFNFNERYFLKSATLEAGKLCDIAPTLLDLAGIDQPKSRQVIVWYKSII